MRARIALWAALAAAATACSLFTSLDGFSEGDTATCGCSNMQTPTGLGTQRGYLAVR